MASSAMHALLLTLAVFVQLTAGQSIVNSTCTTVFDPNTDYFAGGFKNESFAIPLTQVTVTTAEDYTVAYNLSYKILQSYKNNEAYVLYQCGTPKPSVVLPSKAPKFFEVPLTRVAIDSTVAAAFIAMLGATNRIARADLTYAFSPCLHKLQETGQILMFNESNPLEIAGLSAVITSTGKNSTVLAQLPKYIDFGSATGDKAPLKRAEWIKYISTIFNLESTATTVYGKIETNYNCLKSAYSTSVTKPIVAWVSYYDSSWIISGAVYKLEYVKDAGGANLDQTLMTMYNASNPSDLAKFQTVMKSVDVVIDETFYVDGAAPDYNLTTFLSYAKIPAGSVGDYKFLPKKSVWRADRLLADASTFFSWAWFEGAIVEPHVVLSEIAYAIDSSRTRTPTYFRNIALGEAAVIQTSKDCADASGTPAPTIVACPLDAAPVAPRKGSAPSTNPGLLFATAAAAMAAVVLATS